MEPPVPAKLGSLDPLNEEMDEEDADENDAEQFAASSLPPPGVDADLHVAALALFGETAPFVGETVIISDDKKAVVSGASTEIASLPSDHDASTSSAAEPGETAASFVIDTLGTPSNLPAAPVKPSAKPAEESSDDDSSSSDEEELPTPVRPGKAAPKKQALDEDEEDVGVPRSKHEIVEPPVEPVTLTIGPEHEVKRVGTFSHCVDNVLLFLADPNVPVVDIDAVVCLADKRVLGKIEDVIGPVVRPFYAVRVKNPAEFDLKPPTPVFVVTGGELGTPYVIPAQLEQKGSDASGEFDEEPTADDIEFSDDEEEARYKQARKQQRQFARVQEHVTGPPGSQPTQNLSGNKRKPVPQREAAVPTRGPGRGSGRSSMGAGDSWSGAARGGPPPGGWPAASPARGAGGRRGRGRGAPASSAFAPPAPYDAPYDQQAMGYDQQAYDQQQGYDEQQTYDQQQGYYDQNYDQAYDYNADAGYDVGQHDDGTGYAYHDGGSRQGEADGWEQGYAGYEGDGGAWSDAGAGYQEPAAPPLPPAGRFGPPFRGRGPPGYYGPAPPHPPPYAYGGFQGPPPGRPPPFANGFPPFRGPMHQQFPPNYWPPGRGPPHRFF